MIAASTLLAAAAVVAGWSSSGGAVAVLPNGAEFSLEVAADTDSRARGYMFREAVGPRQGMIFVFDGDDRHAFWMSHCRIALDMVWMDANFRVVDVAERQPPCPEQGDCPTVTPRAPGRYVLEFAAGTVARESLHVGDSVVILRNDPPR